MTTRDVKRKLAAILSADVKGYSRLMSEDEVGTIHTLGAYKEVMAGFIQHHHGRVVDAPGDNVLAKFPSVVDAVQCGLKIQNELKTRNAEFSENRRMEFRIGINLGDVVEEEGKIFGDGVNIAARLESLSEAGGICISGKAYDEVKNKLLLGYKYLGEQTVKNVPERIRAYQILLEPQAAGKVIGEKKAIPGRWKITATGLVVILIVVAAAVIWRSYLRTSSTPVEPASKEKMAFPLPDVPSIAVLPFVNMSGDPKQEFFSDGITENIITSLSKVPRLLVISRQSTFFYKDKPVKVKQVSEELGVQYVLEGSVQRSTDRVRINAQLVDALTGHHLWAERYERDLKDLFALQDEITMKILTALQVKLTEGEQARFFALGTDNLEAYLKTVEARELLSRLNRDDNALARRRCEEAIALDPRYAGAYAVLSRVSVMDFVFRVNPEESLKKAYEFAQKAVSLDETQLNAHIALEFMYGRRRQYEEAIASGEQAVKVAPGSAEAYLSLGRALNFAYRDREALGYLEKAIRLNPSQTHYYMHLGFAHFHLRQYEEAVSAFKKALVLAPKNVPSRQGLIATYVEMGRMGEARVEAEELLRIDPKYTSKGFEKRSALRDETMRARWAEALRKAGLERDISAQ